MSKRNSRAEAERQAAIADAALRAEIDAFDARREAAEAEHRQAMAQIRLEREAQQLEQYAGQRIAAAAAADDIAPALTRMLAARTYSSHRDIDEAISAAPGGHGRDARRAAAAGRAAAR